MWNNGCPVSNGGREGGGEKLEQVISITISTVYTGFMLAVSMECH